MYEHRAKSGAGVFHLPSEKKAPNLITCKREAGDLGKPACGQCPRRRLGASAEGRPECAAGPELSAVWTPSPSSVSHLPPHGPVVTGGLSD